MRDDHVRDGVLHVVLRYVLTNPIVVRRNRPVHDALVRVLVRFLGCANGPISG